MTMETTLRAMLPVAILLGCLAGPGGCRCGSHIGEVEADAGSAQPAAGGPMRWCRACAMRSFTACKRVDGQEPEEVLKRKAELAACADVGLSEQECTGSVLSHQDCGLFPEK
jgi:hypothetical protein